MEVIRRDDELDLALIGFPRVQDWRAIEAGESKRVPEDARLYVLGFPRSSDLASEGLLSSHFGPGGKWQTTLPLDYGNSGGPVFDIAGRVIGIAAGGYDEARAMTFVIPFDYARPLHSMVALFPPKNGALAQTTGAAKVSLEFPFSFSVGHEDRRQIQEEFCVSKELRAVQITPSIVSQAGSGTQFLSVNPVPGRANCFRLEAIVAGNGVDRIGPVIVNHKGRGWLSGKIAVEALPSLK